MLREQGRHCPPSACLVGQGCSGRRSRFGECPPCRRHSIHVISAVSLNKPTLWALLPSSQTQKEGSRTLPQGHPACTPSKLLLSHCAASSIREPGPGGTARMPQPGWSCIRRADRALEGNQGALTTQCPGSSRESTTSFAANKCTQSPRPHQAGGAGICKKPAPLRTEQAQARQGLPRRQADLVCRTLTHKMGDTLPGRVDQRSPRPPQPNAPEMFC